MSWQTRLQRNMRIVLGDGEEFSPLWKNASLDIVYNTRVFNFPNKQGSFVHRGTAEGRRSTVIIWFQGEDHLDTLDSFLESAKDSRHWHIIHPYYDDLRVQPVSIKVDNRDYNVSKLTISVVETILGLSPSGPKITYDQITEDKVISDETIAETFANNVPSPSTDDKQVMNAFVDELEDTTTPLIKLNENLAEFKNSLQEARTAIIDATEEPLVAMRAIQSVINFPFKLVRSVRARIDLVVNQFNGLITSIINILGLSQSEKEIFESFANTLMTQMAIIAINPQSGDYKRRPDVLSINEIIINTFNSYIETLDDISTDTGEELDSYIPNLDPMTSVEDLVNLSVSKLFEIAFDAKQERILFLENDSDIINLTHRFLGLDQEDENINEFIDINNIGISENLLIKKGRLITYYV